MLVGSVDREASEEGDAGWFCRQRHALGCRRRKFGGRVELPGDPDLERVARVQTARLEELNWDLNLNLKGTLSWLYVIIPRLKFIYSLGMKLSILRPCIY